MVDKIVEILSPPASPAQEKSGQKNAESQLEKLRKQGDL
jgi:hypothetical protein